MKPYINHLFAAGYPREFLQHLRNDCDLTNDQKIIFDRVTTHTGSMEAHYSACCMRKEYFEEEARKMSRKVVEEVLRLSVKGYAFEETRRQILNDLKARE